MLYSRHYLHVANDVNIWLRPVKGNTGSPRGVKATSAYLRSMSEEKLLIPGRHIQLLDRVGQGIIHDCVLY